MKKQRGSCSMWNMKHEWTGSFWWHLLLPFLAVRDSHCMSKNGQLLQDTEMVGADLGGRVGRQSGLLLTVLCATEHCSHVRMHTHASEAERTRQLCCWCSLFLITSLLGKDNSDVWYSWCFSPQQACCRPAWDCAADMQGTAHWHGPAKGLVLCMQKYL